MSDTTLKTASTQNLKDVVKTVADLGKLISSLSDGLSFDDVSNLVELGQDLPALLRGASLILPEYSALDDAARGELEAYVAQEVKFPANATVELVVQKSLEAIVALSALVKLFS